MTMQKLVCFNHVLVVAEDNSSVTYVENYISTDENRQLELLIS